jgi:hypothetical protein
MLEKLEMLEMLELKKLDLSQLDTLNCYLKNNKMRDCAFCTGNTILWSERYKVSYTIISDMLVFTTEEEGLPSSFTFPIGTNADYATHLNDTDYMNKAREVFDYICDYFSSINRPIVFHCITPELYQIIDSWYPGRFTYNADREDFDYIYSVEKLSSLKGSKLHGKRNHINNFIKNHPDYVYEDISPDNIGSCLDVAKKWQNKHDELAPELADEHAYEYDKIKLALEHMDELNMIGGIIYIDSVPVAFTIGEELAPDTFDVHFEKADDSIQGAYPMINREFVTRKLQNYTYVNREEDMGLPGLRKSKMSYCPDILFEKGHIIAQFL